MGVVGPKGWQGIRQGSWSVRLRVLVLALVVAASVVWNADPAAGGGDGWLVPVDAEVVDPFRPPANRYAAGNRGIEFATATGDPVRAVEAGRVVFAGAVGHSLFVTIDHGNGLRSTSAYLDAILVVRGQQVRRGDLIARASPGFHLTARLGEAYVDPALLFAGAEVMLALVEGPTTPAAPRGVAAETARDWGGVGFRGLIRLVGNTLDLSELVALGGEAGRRWREQDCASGAGGDGAAGGGAVDQGAADVVRPPGDGRLLIQVGGLGSSSDDSSIGDLDALALGYDPNDVVGFSYAGGCTPSPFGVDGVTGDDALGARLGTQPYQPEHTYADVDRAAGYLADLIEAAAVERPGRPIDVAAHSLGGVVARRALEILVGRPGAELPSTVVTIGSPHQGVELADAALAAAPGSLAAKALDRLAPTSAVWDAISVAQVATAGPLALGEPAPPPDGVRVVSIGGATDLIVPLSSTWWDGATNIVVPAGFDDAPELHGELPGLAIVEDEFGRAITGRRPACQSLAAHLAGITRSGIIQEAEDLVALGIGILSLVD